MPAKESRSATTAVRQNLVKVLGPLDHLDSLHHVGGEGTGNLGHLGDQNDQDYKVGFKIYKMGKIDVEKRL